MIFKEKKVFFENGKNFFKKIMKITKGFVYMAQQNIVSYLVQKLHRISMF